MLSVFIVFSCTGVSIAIDRASLVKKGVLDLRGENIDDKGPLPLRGEWEFYYGSFISPERFAGGGNNQVPHFIDVPSTWKGHVVSGKKLPGTGFATYRMVIFIKGTGIERKALLMPAIDTACRLYVNGKTAAVSGSPGKSRETTRPKWVPQIVEIPVAGERIELILHVSNFHHARGGITVTPFIGNPSSISGTRERGVAMKLFTFGSLFIIAMYHLVIFFIRRTEKSALYFGFFGFCMAVRSLVIEEFYLVSLIPALSWEVVVRVTYLTFSLGMPAFAFFIYSLFPDEMRKGALRVLAGAGFFYSLVILVTPATFFTNLIVPYQAVIVGGSFYTLYVLVKAVKRKREESLLFLGAFIFYFLCIINDTLHHNMVISTRYVVPAGFIAFIFLQSVVLAHKYSRAFKRIEELFIEKSKLEGKTVSLQSLSYLDPLTGIANRRMFDEYFETEWKRMRREGESLSLIMIDIDFFKTYNDRFGHPAGDAVLAKVAVAIEDSVSRPGDLVARYGGEEFAVILPGTDIDGAQALSEIIRKKIASLEISAPDVSVSEYVSVSLGCSSILPVSDKGFADLLQAADEALYEAKRQGRNRVVSSSNINATE